MSAPFHEITFPEHVSAGAEAVVRAKTSVVTAGGGATHRNKGWRSQLRQWDVARGIRGESDLEDVRAFHINMDGRHAGFRFRDFSDYRAVAQLIDTSGGGSEFQLRRGYVAGPLTRWRKITKPRKATTQLTLNGAPCVVLEDGQTIEEWIDQWGSSMWGENPELLDRFELDTTTGLLTAVIPEELVEGDVLSATFEFDVPAHFGSDEVAVRAFRRGKTWEYRPILVKELRQ